MIAPHLVEQIEHLLAEGKLSHRKIARQTGVSRGTIGAIASGKRNIRPRPKWPWEDEPLVPDTPPERCPECGGMVYMPCRACRTRKETAKLLANKALSSPHPGPLPKGEGTFGQHGSLRKGEGMFHSNRRMQIVPLGLDLKPAHRERYEEIRRWRRENKDVSPIGTENAGCKRQGRQV